MELFYCSLKPMANDQANDLETYCSSFLSVEECGFGCLYSGRVRIEQLSGLGRYLDTTRKRVLVMQ